MIEKQRNKTGEKEFWKKKKEHTCRAARLTRAGLLLGLVRCGSSLDLCPVQIENISSANHNFVKIRENHGKKSRLNLKKSHM